MDVRDGILIIGVFLGSIVAIKDAPRGKVAIAFEYHTGILQETLLDLFCFPFHRIIQESELRR